MYAQITWQDGVPTLTDTYQNCSSHHYDNSKSEEHKLFNGEAVVEVPLMAGSTYGSSMSNDETDSSSSFISDDDCSSTTSIASENLMPYNHLGRQYLKGLKWHPVDEIYKNYLRALERIFKSHDGGRLIHAPLSQNPQRILDIGTGEGDWAIDMADLYPSAAVVGIDLIPIQPNIVPPNCTFIVDDANQHPWPQHSGSFDLIHIRVVELYDWDSVVNEALRRLNPGGWLEHVDLEIEFGPDCHAWTECSRLLGGTHSRLIFPYGTSNMKEKLAKRGFVDIGTREYTLFSSERDFELRPYIDIKGLLIRRLHELCYMPVEDISTLIAGMEHEFLGAEYGVAVKATRTWARKPKV